MQRITRGFALTPIFTLVLVIAGASPVQAQAGLDEANALYAKGTAKFQEAARAGDSEGQDAAAADLRRALELYDAYLEEHPEASDDLDDELTEINAILFWHGRMSAPDIWDEEDEEPAAGPGKTDEGTADEGVDEEARAEQLERQRVQREERAAQMLERVRQRANAHPDDPYAVRIDLREVIVQFSGTTAAAEAEEELQRVEQLIAQIEAAAAAEAQGQSEEEAAAAAGRPRTRLERLQDELGAMMGSTAEEAVRARAEQLFEKRRFVEAFIEGRNALEEAVRSGEVADRGRIDRVLSALSRGTTILDHALARAADQVGERATVTVLGGGEFEGRLTRMTWKALVLEQERATLHVPIFKLSDESLVDLASAREEAAASLACAAFLVITGEGREAGQHLRKAERLGAAEDEVARLKALAGDERLRADLESEIKKEKRRWSKVQKVMNSVLRDYQKEKFLDCLKDMVKGFDRNDVDDHDLAVIDAEVIDEAGIHLAVLIRDCREKCPVQHVNPNRVMKCPKCNGLGSIQTTAPSGGFGVRTKRPVRVRCPTCKGRKNIQCPHCYARFHDQDVRDLQSRAARAAGVTLEPEGK